MRFRAIPAVAVLLGLLCASSCGRQAGRAIAKQFRRAETVTIIDSKTARQIATVRLSQDLRAMADGLALGEAGAEEQGGPTFILVLEFPDGSEGKAYVEVDYRADPSGEIRRGCVQYQGIGQVHPRALFWDVFDKYVLPALPASRRPRT